MKSLECADQQGGYRGEMILCPACGNGHLFDAGRWTFNGDREKPTFSPSMLVKSSSWQNIRQDQWMPVQGQKDGVEFRVPFAMLSEVHAQRLHSQTLDRLRERGGLSAHEALCHLDRVGLRDRSATADDERILSERVQAWLKDACPPEVCHSFVRDGRIEFLGDCTHSLAGQTVDLPDWETHP